MERRGAEERHGDRESDRRHEGLDRDRLQEEQAREEERERQGALDRLVAAGGEFITTELRTRAEQMVTDGLNDIGNTVIDTLVDAVVPAPVLTFVAEAAEQIPPEMRESFDFVNDMLNPSVERDVDPVVVEETRNSDLRLLTRVTGLTTAVGTVISTGGAAIPIAVAIGAAYEVYRELNPNEPPAPPMFFVTTKANPRVVVRSDASYEAFKTLLVTWQRLPDTTWWPTFASFIRENTYFTIYDHVVMLQTVMFLSPVVPVVWTSHLERWEIVEKIVSFYHLPTTVDISELYTFVLTLQYQDAPLPRATAANLLVFALGKILLDANRAQVPIKRLDNALPLASFSLMSTAHVGEERPRALVIVLVQYYEVLLRY